MQDPKKNACQSVPFGAASDRSISVARLTAILLGGWLLSAGCSASDDDAEGVVAPHVGEGGTDASTVTGGSVGTGGAARGGEGGTNAGAAGNGGDERTTGGERGTIAGAAGAGGEDTARQGGAGGTAGAPGSEFPTCEELYDGTAPSCGVTPAYGALVPGEGCRGTYENVNIDFDADELGYSARDVLDAVFAPGTGSLVWFDGLETTIHLALDLEGILAEDGSDVERDAAPPGEGYCSRSLLIRPRDPAFSIGTEDGRIDWLLAGFLSAHDHGCGIQEIVVNLDTYSGAEAPFEVPEEWLVPEAEEAYIEVRVNSSANRCSPFCTPSDGDCFPEAWGGKILYTSIIVDENDHVLDVIEQLIAEWTWDE